MARKADVKGGNGDVVFNAKTGTASENSTYFKSYAIIQYPTLLR